jgi:hypothetical protein
MKNTFTLSLRVLIGVVFVFSAYSKLIAPGIVEIILVDHALAATRETAAVFVRLLVGLEFALGLMFFQPFSLRKIVIPLSFLFLIGFTAYLVYTGFILKDSQNCGCFGEMIKMSPVESIIKNIFLTGLLIVLFKRVEEKKNYFIFPVILVLTVAAVFLADPIKSQKDFKFSKYTSFENAGRVDLSSGDKLIFILNSDCDHCQALVKELSKIQNEKWFPESYALLFLEGNVSVNSFKTLTNFNLSYHIIGATEFFNLIGLSPPRIYRLHNGNVKEIWDKDFIENISKTYKIK